MIVAPVPVGARLVDTVAKLGPTELRALKDDGVDGVIGYLGGNLTPDLVSNALALRMGLVPVNFSRSEGWIPSVSLGEADAAGSTRRLSALGIPTRGLVDWCDLEGCGGDPTGYLNAWSSIVADQGRIAGLYVGAGGLLSGHQLYALPGFTRYWRSLSRGISEPDCGFVMSQCYPTTTLGGVSVDVDFAQHDFLGRSGTWVCSDTQA